MLLELPLPILELEKEGSMELWLAAEAAFGCVTFSEDAEVVDNAEDVVAVASLWSTIQEMMARNVMAISRVAARYVLGSTMIW